MHTSDGTWKLGGGKPGKLRKTPRNRLKPSVEILETVHLDHRPFRQSYTHTSPISSDLSSIMVDSAVKDHQTKKRKKSTSKPNDTAAQAGPSKPSPSTARLFQPFRALGYVTNHVPFAMWVHTPRGALAKPAINIVTSVGKSWMMWNADKITLLFVGKESVGEIRGLVMNGTSIFASAGDRVTKYERGQEVSTKADLGHGQQADVKVFRWVAPGQPQLGKIYLFGDQLLALKEDGTGLVIFDHVQRRKSPAFWTGRQIPDR